MNRKELVDSISTCKDCSTVTKKQLDYIVYYTMENIKKTVKKGETVSLIGFGTFTKAKRKARNGINPSTGEQIKIKARNVVKFRAGKAWLETL